MVITQIRVRPKLTTELEKIFGAHDISFSLYFVNDRNHLGSQLIISRYLEDVLVGCVKIPWCCKSGCSLVFGFILVQREKMPMDGTY